MKQLTRVLCAVDVGEPGRAAFVQALALASVRGAALLVVVAVPPSQAFNAGSTERVAFLVGLRHMAEAAGVDMRVSVQHGEAAEIILLHARARLPDLIVLSAFHDGGRGTPPGSVAEDVLRDAECPTLVVGASRRSLRPVSSFANVICAVDLTAASGAAVDAAVSLGPLSGRTVTLVHVVKGPDDAVPSPARVGVKEYDLRVHQDALRRLQALVPRNAEGAVRVRVATGHVVTEIFRTVRAVGADLVVIAARRRSRLRRQWFGVSRGLLRATDCPILAVPVRPAEVRRAA